MVLKKTFRTLNCGHRQWHTGTQWCNLFKIHRCKEKQRERMIQTDENKLSIQQQSTHTQKVNKETQTKHTHK